MKFRACLNERNATIEVCSNRISLQSTMDATAYWPDVAFFAFAPVFSDGLRHL
jgi:hypothetical protein